MGLIRDVLKELGAMFWADRRLNLGLLAVTAIAALAAPVAPAGVLPLPLALGYAAVLARAVIRST